MRRLFSSSEWLTGLLARHEAPGGYADGIVLLQSHPSPGKASFPAESHPVNREHSLVNGDNNFYFSR